jgi:low affinity Fe/Cu permease
MNMQENHEKYSIQREVEQALEVIDIQLELGENERDMSEIFNKIDELLSLDSNTRNQIIELAEGENVDSKTRQDILDYLEEK